MADTWLKLGTSILADAEIRNLSPSAFRGWVLGLAHCAHNLTDGLIEDKALRLIDVKAKERDELICAGLWKPIALGVVALGALAAKLFGGRKHTRVETEA